MSSLSGSLGTGDRRPQAVSVLSDTSMSDRSSESNNIPGNKRTTSHLSGSNSQNSSYSNFHPALVKGTSKVSLSNSISSQQAVSDSSTSPGSTRSVLRKRRKTLDAVRPDHIPPAEATRSYVSTGSFRASRESLRQYDSMSRESFGRGYDSFSRGRAHQSSRSSIAAVFTKPLLFEGNEGDPMRQWEEESRRRGPQSINEEVPSARRYTDLERPTVDENSGLKVSSVLSWKRVHERKNSVTSSLASGASDSSRLSSLVESRAVGRSDTGHGHRSANLFEMP